MAISALQAVCLCFNCRFTLGCRPTQCVLSETHCWGRTIVTPLASRPRTSMVQARYPSHLSSQHPGNYGLPKGFLLFGKSGSTPLIPGCPPYLSVCASKQQNRSCTQQQGL